MNPILNDPEQLIFVIVSILVALVIHEFVHAYTGFKLGDTTAAEHGRLSFNPLSHIDPFMTVALPIMTLILFGAPILAAKPVPFNPDRVRFDEFGAALIAAAGPFSNLVLAFGGALLLNAVTGGMLTSFLVIFVTINVALFVFNMIPIPPLDGSRVLYAFSPEPLQKLLEEIEPYGFFFIIALVLMGGLSFITGINDAILRLLP